MTTTIEFKNADIYQRDNKLILSNVNVQLHKGEFVYLIGKVGSGKTSLIKTIFAELPLKQGYGKVAEFELRNFPRENVPFLRRKLGIIFQDFQLLTDRNVYNNLKFVLDATDWKNDHDKGNQIQNALEIVGLADKIKRMPHELSGGEQQRVVIARALLNNPEIILADEPTGNLDPETSNGIMELLHEIKNLGKTILMATHNYNLISKFESRVIKCENGKVLEVIGDLQ